MRKDVDKKKNEGEKGREEIFKSHQKRESMYFEISYPSSLDVKMEKSTLGRIFSFVFVCAWMCILRIVIGSCISSE